MVSWHQIRKTVGDSFNQYFTTAAQKFIIIIGKLGSTNDNFEKYLTSTNPHSFFIDPVTPEEVNDIIANLDENKANDSYDIPSKLIEITCLSIRIDKWIISLNHLHSLPIPPSLKLFFLINWNL